MTGPMAPELVSDSHAWVGEGPLWDARRGVLWWVDILAGDIHAFEPTTGTDRAIAFGTEVGCLAPMADGRLLVGATDRVAALDPGTGGTETIAPFPAAEPRLRCNDGKCDPAGRFWVGRMAFDAAAGAGSLLCLPPHGSPTPVLRELTIPNGLAWTADGRTMVHVDSPTRTVRRYPFDPASGALGAGEPLFDLVGTGLPPDAVPDGLTIDAEDRLWVAVWGGGCVLRIALDGRLLDRVDLPVSQVSSCTFGGPDLGDLYVTSAREGFSAADELREPHAGGLFRVRTAARGRPPDTFGG